MGAIVQEEQSLYQQKGVVQMAENGDGGVSKEFKKKVEELCDRLAPKNKENNACMAAS